MQHGRERGAETKRKGVDGTRSANLGHGGGDAPAADTQESAEPAKIVAAWRHRDSKTGRFQQGRLGKSQIEREYASKAMAELSRMRKTKTGGRNGGRPRRQDTQVW